MEEFIPPPEAPVFQPTMEEFRDPVAYISKIRPVVVNTGICKIRPPSGWKPPFAVDIEAFRFTPRIQPLNELEAKTRVKLNFLEKLAKFWELQGIVFKIPNVDKSPLDLHKLFKVVVHYGGFSEVSRQRRWSTVAKEMGFSLPTVSSCLRIHYERYLYPYELFLVKKGKLETCHSPSKSGSERSTPAQETPIKCKYGLRQNKRRDSNWEDPDYSIEMDEANPEFKKLAFTAPGPKNSFAPLKRSDYYGDSGKRRDMNLECHPPIKKEAVDGSVAETTPSAVTADSGLFRDQEAKVTETTGAAPPAEGEGGGASRQLFGSADGSCGDKGESMSESMQMTEPMQMSGKTHVFQCGAEGEVDDVKCYSCQSGDNEEELLICDNCEIGYHTFCLDSPLPSIPPGSWSCPKCVADECIKPTETFGFEQAKQQYSLTTFQLKANHFKQDYFKKSVKQVPCADVEREFWRLVSSIEDDVVVEYGADLLTSQVGSGFPMEEKATSPEEKEYALSSWNLNNLPSIKGSVLSYVDADISGMKVPWAYVGMCFSCFCWHIEDHWSYSINYLHWGEPKTWYGVPSAYAESLEATMKDQAPELFENQPDLLHHLVTTLSPNILMKQGIPVVRTDQRAGEFVVTFPRAYHAGFNQGFNFAEAVNFSLADWLPVGRESINHYRAMRRSPVFSHDELVCKMMAQPDRLELCLLLTTGQDSEHMIQLEKVVQCSLKEKGISQQEREYFELSNDDERQCLICKTCCFLSAIRCPCSPNRLVCPFHVDDLCACPMNRKVLRYRYTLEELGGMLRALQERSCAYQDWLQQVETLLDGRYQDKPDLAHLRDLLSKALAKGYGNSEPCDELRATIEEADACSSKALQLASRKHVVTRRGSTAMAEKKMGVEELVKFMEQVEALPCQIPEANILQDQLAEVYQFQVDAEAVLSIPHSPGLASQLEELVKRAEALDVVVPEMTKLRVVLSQLQWMSESEEKLRVNNLTLDTLKSLLNQGTNLTQESPGENVAMESVLSKIRSILSEAQVWEEKSKEALKEKPYHTLEYFVDLLEKAGEIPVELPSVATLKNTLDNAHQWSRQAQSLQDSDRHPHYDTLKTMLASGRPIPVKLGLLAQLESRFAAAKAWVDRALRTFMKKNCNLSLLEVLLPRNKANFLLRHINNKSKRRPETGELAVAPNPLSELNGERLREMDRIHEMEIAEVKFAQTLRDENLRKMELDEDVKNGIASSSAPILYCFCRKPESGYMLQCELCLEWYHASCLHIPKGKRMPGKDLGKESRFLCLACQRTRRPRLDAIVSLLISLQKVPVAISEGTALHCLAERAIAWQRKAKLGLQNLTLILEASRHQMKRTEELRNHIKRWRQEASTTIEANTTSIQAQLASSAGSVLHHYETELQRLRSEYAGLSGTKRKELETLLMEGDLLEVTLDEVYQLWTVLHQDTVTLAAFERFELEDGEGETGKAEEGRRRRKRKGASTTMASSSAGVSAASSSTTEGGLVRGARVPAPKRQKRTARSTTPKSSPSPAPSNTSSQSVPVGSMCEDPAALASRPPFPASRQNVMPKLRKVTQNVPLANRTCPSDGLGCNEKIPGEEVEEDEDDEKDEEEAECSAPRCKRPIADEISWVQCDLCQEWFHCSCVGLTKEYAEKIDKYNCRKCIDRSRNSAAGVSVAKGGGSSVGVAKGGATSNYRGGGGVGSSGGDQASGARGGASSSGSNMGGGVKTKAVHPLPMPSSSGSPIRGSRVLSAATASTQDLVKGILQNPQLAAQLLSNIPRK